MNRFDFYLPVCFALLLASLTFVVGCGDGRPTRVPVSGQVLMDGKPLTTGFVRVIPENGRPASGQLGKDGRFSLTTYEKNDGCLFGTHPVEIYCVDNSNEDYPVSLIPTKYNKHSTSGLSVSIEAQTDDLLIEISRKGP